MNPNCPTKGKRGWKSEALATAALSHIWAKGFKRGPGKLPTRAYKCKCGDWHLTSGGPR